MKSALQDVTAMMSEDNYMSFDAKSDGYPFHLGVDPDTGVADFEYNGNRIEFPAHFLRAFAVASYTIYGPPKVDEITLEGDDE
jgi:hypothetical protein